jgi:hypothetical protein
MAETRKKIDEMKRNHVYREKQKSDGNGSPKNSQVEEFERQKVAAENSKRLVSRRN